MSYLMFSMPSLQPAKALDRVCARSLIPWCLVSVLVLLLSACGGDSAEEHLARAERYLSEGEFNEASIELKNALQKDSNSAKTRWLLGKVYLDTGDVLSAEKELLLAQQLGWAADDIHPALAQALLAQGKFAAVRELSHDGLEPQAAARLLATKALSELAQGETEEAQKLIALALEKEAQLAEVQMAHAKVLAGTGNLQQSRLILDDILAEAPDQREAWSLKGDILLRQRNLAQARIAFDQSIALAPNAFPDRFKRSLINLLIGEYEAAQADAKKLLEIAPQHSGGNYVQGLLQFKDKKYSEAISSLILALQASHRFPMISYYLGSAYLIEGNLDQAEEFAESFFDFAPDNPSGRKLLATVKLMQKDYDNVQELLQPVLDRNPRDIAALNLMANALLRGGKSDQGIDLFKRIAQLQPDSPTAQVKLGAGLIMSGQSEEGTARIETALDLDPEFQQADILMVLNYAQKKDFEKAIDAAEAYRRRNPASAIPLNLLGRVYLSSGRPEDARDSFEKVLRLEPGDPAANHHLAQIALAADDTSTAREHYQAILEDNPESLLALLQLAALDDKEHKEQAMLNHLERAISAHPKALQPRLALGRYYLMKGKPEQVPPLFSTLEESQMRSPPVLTILALAQLAGNQHTDAGYTLEQLIESTPESPSYHHLLAMAASGAGDNVKAKEQLQQAMALDGSYLPSQIALAKFALAEQSFSEFDQYLERLTELAPDDPGVLSLRAAGQYRSGDKAAAIELASDAHDAYPSSQTLLELAQYEELAGNSETARQLLIDWIEKHSDDIGVRMALAGRLSRDNLTKAATAQYEAVLEIDPNNVMALNNLAWYRRLDSPKEALKLARRASELAPNQPEVLDSLAVIEYLNGDNRRARRAIERALAVSPDNPSMQYHSAMIAAALGESDTALVILEKILGEGATPFPEKAEASELLKSLRG